MKSVAENLQMLSRAVLKRARGDAKQMLADARNKADAELQRARQEADAVRARIIEEAQQEVQRIHNQCLAGAQLSARTLKLERREELLDEVYDAVRQRLPTVRQWTDYDQVVHYLVSEAVAQLGADRARIRADEQAQAFLSQDTLTQLAQDTAVELTLGDPLESGTGVIAETSDGHLQVVNTLEARLARSEEALRFSVYRVLMGESL
jgi:vacuolar-type H+-ATPase subunit E/Vma4